MIFTEEWPGNRRTIHGEWVISGSFIEVRDNKIDS